MDDEGDRPSGRFKYDAPRRNDRMERPGVPCPSSSPTGVAGRHRLWPIFTIGLSRDLWPVCDLLAGLGLPPPANSMPMMLRRHALVWHTACRGYGLQHRGVWP